MRPTRDAVAAAWPLHLLMALPRVPKSKNQTLSADTIGQSLLSSLSRELRKRITKLPRSGQIRSPDCPCSMSQDQGR